jgi:hypothetical protein
VSARPGVEIIRDRKEKETEGGDRKTTIHACCTDIMGGD